MTAATFVQPNYTTQSDSTAYPLAIDAAIAVIARTGAAFAPHEQDTPDMTVRLDAGAILNGVTLTEVAAQSTGTITAPVSNPRIDRIVVDASTGAVSVIGGVEGASPSAPAITSGKYPVAQVLLATSTTEITNSLITDERVDFSGSSITLGVSAGNAVQVDQTITATTRATTTTLGTSLNHTLSDTSANVSAFNGVAGVTYHCRALGAGTLVHHATDLIITQTGATITTAAGDTFDVEMITGTTCRVKNYQRASGEALTSSAGISLDTVQATTSGTAFDFTVPAGTKKITMMLSGVSLSGTDSLLVQGNAETTGYTSISGDVANNVSSTAGFIIRAQNAAVAFDGTYVLNLFDAATFKWVGSVGGGPNVGTGGGSKTFSAGLTSLTLTRTGTDAFDAGAVNIQYE